MSKKNRIHLFVFIFTVLCLNPKAVATEKVEYQGSRAIDVWNEISKDQYSQLPQPQVSIYSLFRGTYDLIRFRSQQTISDRSDLIPYFNKLAHPTGVCMLGVWSAKYQNPYSGLFKPGTQSLMIARASVALDQTRVGSNRGMGFAGKIFPTQDGHELVPTANFFLIDDLGGTKAKHYMDVEMTNSPAVSANFSLFTHLAYAAKVAHTFKLTDKNPGERQVYEIAERGLSTGERVQFPRRMMIRKATGVVAVDQPDYRQELLSTILEPENLGVIVFDVFVSESENPKKEEWQRVGDMTFSSIVASESCDHRLHFHHPKYR